VTAPCPTFGFVVSIDSRAELDDPTRKAFRDAWMGFLEQRGLYCGGGDLGDDTQEYVIVSDASQATDSDRTAVREWLRRRPELRAFRIGELIDLSQAL
jgi:uncharacterized protein YggL (DUF469 family)